MTTDGKEDKDSAGTEENEDECVVLNGIQGEEGLAAPPATTQTPTSMTRISAWSRHGDQTTTGKGGGKGKEREGRNDDEHRTNEAQKCHQMETTGIETFTGDGSSKKKKKIALFFGYNGDGYQGMQRNPGAKTIEDDLESAIVKAGGIAESNAGDFNKVHWNRAARTDKGVSAVGQVVSFKCMNADDGNTETIVRLINEHLPRGKIVAFGATRVTGGFSAKNQCDRRKYEYVVPVRTFDRRFPKKRKRNPVDGDDENGHDEKKNDENAPNGEGLEDEKEDDEENNDTQEEEEPYVFTEEERTKVNGILKHFVGTHNFHNYSTKVDCDTPQARRFVISFSCSMPFKIQGEDFVKFEILGQSFLFNMIRKLVGMTVAVARDFCDVSDLLFALRTKQRVNTPMAPELGLFLCECQYDAYNKRFSAEREPLRLENWRDKVDAFKHQTVYQHIYDREYVMKDNMGEWIRKFISDKNGFREHYDLAMHRALLKEEKLAPLSTKNSQKQRVNSSQNQQGAKASPNKPSSSKGGEGEGDVTTKSTDDSQAGTAALAAAATTTPTPTKPEENEEALLLLAANAAAERVAKKRKLELEKQEARKRIEIEKQEERVRNGFVVGKVEYDEDEMSD
jgi:tRNA pseudouridine38-40 synthase